MTIAICFNEHNLHWVYDSSKPFKAISYPETPAGDWWAIAGAYTGEALKVVFFQETDAELPEEANPEWMGILGAMGIELSKSYDPSAPITDYPDFVSPDNWKLKLVASDYLSQWELPTFSLEDFITLAAEASGLQKSQVESAIYYSQKIVKDSFAKGIDPKRRLDDLYTYLQESVGSICPETYDIHELLGA